VQKLTTLPLFFDVVIAQLDPDTKQIIELVKGIHRELQQICTGCHCTCQLVAGKPKVSSDTTPSWVSEALIGSKQQQ
jgi:hypothetical protein